MNPNRKQTEPNWFEPFFVLKKPNQTETGRFEPGSVFFKKITVWLLFFDKNRTESKMITPKFFLTLTTDFSSLNAWIPPYL
jgi:hypothetical protein